MPRALHICGLVCLSFTLEHTYISYGMFTKSCLGFSHAYQPPAQPLPHLTQYIIHKLTYSLTGSQSEQSKCATNGS